MSWAEELGFRELYDKIAQRGGPGLAWGISLRVKRGLSNPGGRGVYAKDVVYFRGLRTVRDWLSEGGRLEQHYVGKVAVHHPVQEWLDAGLIQSGGVPVLFEGHACAS